MWSKSIAYDSVTQPNHIETVIATFVPTGQTGIAIAGIAVVTMFVPMPDVAAVRRIPCRIRNEIAGPAPRKCSSPTTPEWRASIVTIDDPRGDLRELWDGIR